MSTELAPAAEAARVAAVDDGGAGSRVHRRRAAPAAGRDRPPVPGTRGRDLAAGVAAGSALVAAGAGGRCGARQRTGPTSPAAYRLARAPDAVCDAGPTGRVRGSAHEPDRARGAAPRTVLVVDHGRRRRPGAAPLAADAAPSTARPGRARRRRRSRRVHRGLLRAGVLAGDVPARRLARGPGAAPPHLLFIESAWRGNGGQQGQNGFALDQGRHLVVRTLVAEGFRSISLEAIALPSADRRRAHRDHRRRAAAAHRHPHRAAQRSATASARAR